MEFDAATRESIEELQILEHSLQNIALEKQTMQISLNELRTAQDEVQKTENEIYKVVGGIMIRTEKTPTLAELAERTKTIEMRIAAVEKQEHVSAEKAQRLRAEIMKKVGVKKNGK